MLENNLYNLDILPTKYYNNYARLSLTHFGQHILNNLADWNRLENVPKAI